MESARLGSGAVLCWNAARIEIDIHAEADKFIRWAECSHRAARITPADILPLEVKLR